MLGFPHWVGVVMVGSIVILIVATAGMTSTTYVQFIKGGLLIIFSLALTLFILKKGVNRTPSENFHEPVYLEVVLDGDQIQLSENQGYRVLGRNTVKGEEFVKLGQGERNTWWRLDKTSASPRLEETLSISVTAEGLTLYNGAPKEAGLFYQVGHASKIVMDGREVSQTGPLGPLEYIRVLEASEIVRYTKVGFEYEGEQITLYHLNPTAGAKVMKPGLYYKLDQASSILPRIDFFSLMLALFLGTSALPHVLIRYYTVPSQRAARKSTIVAISAIGFFYILTLYMGSGAMVNGTLDLGSSNMSAPLLAKTFGIALFSIISAIAFATILGTVSGLIVASSGAVAHDLMDKYLKIKMTEKGKVMAGRWAAVCVGLIAIILGILFEKQNVSFLVGLAFAIAASANLPAILMLLFWKKTTAKGIAWALIVGMVSALVLILISPTMYEVYNLPAASAPFPLRNPGIISIPLGFITLVGVSLMTRKKEAAAAES